MDITQNMISAVSLSFKCLNETFLQVNLDKT